jgi:hypothetical protein
MSIQDEIVDKVTRNMLFPVLPRAAGATIRRALMVGESLWNLLNSPEGDAAWEERIALLQADLELFVTEERIAPKYLFLLFPAADAVWEIRSARHDPSMRIMGLFAEKDTLIATNFARREDLGGWQDRRWKIARRIARAIWRQLFNTYQPIQTVDVKQVCSGASDEIYYKERH